MPTNRVLNHRRSSTKECKPRKKRKKEKEVIKEKMKKKMKHRLDWEGRLALYATPPTSTHLHQRQPARSEAAAMTVPFPALA
jgi:hypothetical protein